MRDFDERTYSRYECLGEARLQLAGTRTEMWARVHNISFAGCLVRFSGATTLLAGDDAEMTLLIGGTTLRMRGWAVPDANDERRVGFLFATMSAQTRTALNGLVQKLEAEQPVAVEQG